MPNPHFRIWVNDGDGLKPGDLVIEDVGKSVERSGYDPARIFRIVRPFENEGFDFIAELVGEGHTFEIGTK